MLRLIFHSKFEIIAYMWSRGVLLCCLKIKILHIFQVLWTSSLFRPREPQINRMQRWALKGRGLEKTREIGGQMGAGMRNMSFYPECSRELQQGSEQGRAADFHIFALWWITLKQGAHWEVSQNSPSERWSRPGRSSSSRNWGKECIWAVKLAEWFDVGSDIETTVSQLGYSGSTTSRRKFRKDIQNWGRVGRQSASNSGFVQLKRGTSRWERLTAISLKVQLKPGT